MTRYTEMTDHDVAKHFDALLVLLTLDETVELAQRAARAGNDVLASLFTEQVGERYVRQSRTTMDVPFQIGGAA